MSDLFDQIPEEGQQALPPPEEPPIVEAPAEEPVDEVKLAERLEKFLNMLASDNEHERGVAAAKIGALAATMKMPVADALRKLFGAERPAVATIQSEPDIHAGAGYTASGVPLHQRKQKSSRHNIDRLEEAFKANADKLDEPLDEYDLRDIDRVLQMEFDWQLDRWQTRFVRNMTKRLLLATEEPLV